MGKDSFTQKWVIETSVVIIICIVFGGATWVKLFKTGQLTFINTAINIITRQESAESKDKSTTTAPVQTTSPTLTPKP